MTNLLPALTGIGKFFERLLLVAIIVALALAGLGSYGLREWENWKAAQRPVAITDTGLTIPATITVRPGKPSLLQADTLGKRVIWMSMDPEVEITERDQKSIWVYATEKAKPGDEYRVIAWTSVNNLPTTNATTIVKVSEPLTSEGSK